MTKNTTKVTKEIENQRGKVKVDITLSYAEFGDPQVDSVKSDCEEFLAAIERKYMPREEGSN